MPTVHAAFTTSTIFSGIVMGAGILGLILGVIYVGTKIAQRKPLREIKHQQHIDESPASLIKAAAEISLTRSPPGSPPELTWSLLRL